MYAIVLVFVVFLTAAYMWHVHRSLSTTPAEAARVAEQLWTKEQIQDAYRKAQSDPVDVKPFLFGKKNRRYTVVGGSGFVGGWIIQHLLTRGENPAAIRIIDLAPPRRKEILENDLSYVRTDVTDAAAVLQAFQVPWPIQVNGLPLTVFNTVAYINAFERTSDFISTYERINIKGAENVAQAARQVGASIFIFTSSSTVSLIPPSFFPWPWEKHSKSMWQVVPNAYDKKLGRPLDEFASCYSWSKARAEHLVQQANSPTDGFLTGSIRPGAAIVGRGGANAWSLSYDYLRRGGSPTWIYHVVVNLVDAQNVAVAHLAYENALLKPGADTKFGGRAYVVTDPGPPVTYGHLYQTLETLAHPLTPTRFPHISTLPLLLVSYPIEAYRILRRRLRFLNALPDLTGDIGRIAPAMFQMCSVHTAIDDSEARNEIGYVAPYSTLEGLALAVLEWNNKVEEDAQIKIGAGKAEEVEVRKPSNVPKGAIVP